MYQALYRKYRPTAFSSVYGQDAIVKTLKNALQTNKITHAYLFSGPRGTGKTTIAKILAKNVNCLAPVDNEACEHCEACQEINSHECIDIVEIDAASNNGVDEIRELKNKINFTPATLKYKVYIIDEVHMLSIGAFNALLKTLEEPPSHVIFILATTEPHKVPITIVSRCQCYNFKKISPIALKTRLLEIVQLENIDIEDTVLDEISKYVDGGMRDAIGMLDQLSSYSSDKITLQDFENVNGLIPKKDLNLFVEKILAFDIHLALEEIQSFQNSGKDMIRLTMELIDYLRDMLINFYLNRSNVLVDEKFVYDLIVRLNHTLFDMKNASNAKVLLEICLIGIMAERSSLKNNDVNDTVEKVTVESKRDISKLETDKEMKLDSFSPVSTVNLENNERNCKLRELNKIRINNTFARASKQNLLELKEKWKQLSDHTLNKEIGYLVCLLVDGTLRAASDENIVISYEYESLVEKAKSSYDELLKILQDLLNVSYHLVFITDEEWNVEKNEFIRRKNENIKYEYIEEIEIPSLSSCGDSSTMIENEKQSVLSFSKSVVDLFGEDMVEIK